MFLRGRRRQRLWRFRSDWVGRYAGWDVYADGGGQHWLYHAISAADVDGSLKRK
jgi:hypothetical protein